MTVQLRALYQFGPFQLDLERNLLLRAGEVVPLTHKAFQTLAVLVQNRGRIVEKEELMREIWPDTFVEEGSLARNVSVLRKTLGEGPADHQYIETIPKRGYRFVAPVQEVPDESPAFNSTLPPIELSEPPAITGPEPLAQSSSPANIYVNGTTAHTPGAQLEIQPTAARPKRLRWPLILGSLLLVASLVTVYYFSHRAQPVTSPSLMQVTRFTNTGKAIDAAISRDGKYVVYVIDEAGQQSLWVKQVVTGSNAQIIAPADVSYQGLTFSPDGNYLYYNLWDKKGVGVIYRVPSLGGPSTRVLVDVMPGIAIAPDGQQIAVIRGYARQEANGQALLIVNVDGSNERKLATRSRTGWFNHVVWSPDGTKIAFTASQLGTEEPSYMEVLEVPVAGGPERVISARNWLEIAGLAWPGDGHELIIAATDQPKSPCQIWSVAYSSGEARQLTNDLSGYGGLSLTADSSALVTVERDAVTNVWVAPNGDASQAKKITSARYEGYGLSWTPDGRIVYVSAASGNPDLWIMDQTGQNKRQLTFDDSVEFDPSVTADGRHIVFVSNRAGTFNLWRVELDGSNPQQLTTGAGEWAPYCSPAGPEVVYVSVHQGKQNLFKLSLEGGPPQRLTNHNSHLPAISPDGKLIAYSFWDEEAQPQQWGRELIELASAAPVRRFEVPRSALGSQGSLPFHWTPDGRALTYVNNHEGVSNIWRQAVDGNGTEPARQQITDFKDDQIFSFAWSRDGKQLACTRGRMTSDVILIKDFK